jgi:hypothetical protein
LESVVMMVYVKIFSSESVRLLVEASGVEAQDREHVVRQTRTWKCSLYSMALCKMAGQ